MRPILYHLSQNQVYTYREQNYTEKRVSDIQDVSLNYLKELFGDTENGEAMLCEFDMEFFDINGAINNLSHAERFSYGYKLGVCIITELFQGREKLIP